ncbi:MAG: DUF2442 domain-containing protein [Planctomycetes bacterium]|nr:DUF2442 domain-containing protein [Planctomycetota bacterium]
MYVSVINVKPLDNFKLLLTFENHENRIFDVKPYLSLGIFKELNNPNIFNTVRISFDSIEWINSADIDPEILYRDSVPA